MLNIRIFQSGYELFATLCIVGDSDLAGIYVDSTPSRGLPPVKMNLLSLSSAATGNRKVVYSLARNKHKYKDQKFK